MPCRRPRPPQIARSPRLLRALPFVCSLVACSPAPVAVPRATPASIDPPTTSATHVAAARWIQSGGATAVGPRVSSGTLVLLGGRRAIVSDDGAVRSETAPCPEPLLELAHVPAPNGERRLVGRGVHGIFRFDDPLGAPTTLARSEVELRSLGVGPGLIAVWDLQSELPRFLDLETGQPKPMANLPGLPARAMRFLTLTEGAAVFHGAGLATTVDGGVTWRPAAEAARGDALKVNGLRVRNGGLRAFMHPEGRDAAIDIAGSQMGPFDEVTVPTEEPPLLRWIRITRRDPLEAAVTGGILAPAGGAFVASHGLFARVDLGTGLLLELTEFAHGSGVNACATARAAGTAWVGCALSEENEADLYDPFGVLGVALSGRLVAERPAIARNGEAELRVSPSGGVMFVAACNAEEPGDACVRQPDGRWITFEVDVNLTERGVGPLADGRIAYLRGLYERDDSPDTEAEESQGPPIRAPYVVTADATGVEHRLAPSIWSGRASGDFKVQGYVQEDEGRAVHFLVSNDEGVFAFVQGPNGANTSFQKVPAVRHARLRGDQGIAVGGRKIKASLDGGRSWTDVEAPERIAQALERIGELDDTAFAVTEVGAKIGSQLRLGWGPAEVAKPALALGGAALGPRSGPPPSGPENVLTCNGGDGASPGTPPALGAFQIRALLGAAAPVKGTRRVVTSRGSGSLDAIAMLEEEGPEKAAAPATWTLRWLDPLEIGGKVHTWSGPAPKNTRWGSGLTSAAVSSGRGLFAVHSGGRYLLVRAKSGGGVEIVEMGLDAASSDAVFSADRGEPIAWLRDTQLYVWLAGETPRVIGSIATFAQRTLGQPTPEGVPVLIAGSDWAQLRTFPFPQKAAPPAPKRGPRGRAPEPAAPDPAPKAADPRAASKAPLPSIDGWTPVVNVRRQASRLPACGAKPRGVKMAITRPTLGVRVDGIEESASSVVYDVRLAGDEACVASLAALVSPVAGESPGPSAKAVVDGPAVSPSSPPKKSPGKPITKGPKGAKGEGGDPRQAPKAVGFVRADFAGKRGEGGDRGLPKAAGVRKLTCSLAGPS
jgi:hypothetical protein